MCWGLQGRGCLQKEERSCESSQQLLGRIGKPPGPEQSVHLSRFTAKRHLLALPCCPTAFAVPICCLPKRHGQTGSLR